MASFRRLPFELQALLAQLPALRTATPVRFPPALLRRALSTPAIAINRNLSSVADDEVQEAPAQNLFETTNTEYSHIPLSKLDHPPAARTPADSLIALLDSNQHAEAGALLKDFREAGQYIPRHLRFAKHAEELLKADPASDWLEWWSLAPPLSSFRTVSLGQVKQNLRQLDARAARIVDALLEDQPHDWERLKRFAVLLAQHGHARVVAERLLVHFAAYAPQGMGEELFGATMAALQRQLKEVAGMGSLAFRTLAKRRRDRKLSEEQRQLVKERRYDEGAARGGEGSPPRLYLARRTMHEVDLMAHIRQRMILAHANFGRLDLAVNLVSASRGRWEISGRACRISKTTILRLLALASATDRFNLFNQLYACLEANGGRLTRVQKAGLRRRIPYFARGVDYEAPDAIPSAKEAFSTWRYASYVGSMEEGGLTEAPIDVQTGPSPSRDPFLAALNEQPINLGRVSKHLLAAIADNSLPLPRDTARFIRLSRQNNQEDQLAALEEFFDPRSGISPRLTRFWYTSSMLSHLEHDEHAATLRLFVKFFDVTGFGAELQQAFSTYAPHARKIALKHRIRPDAYVFSLAIQALIPIIDPKVAPHQPIPSRNTLVERLFFSLLTSPPSVIPIRSSPSTKTTPLDPATFTPFLQTLFNRRLPPSQLLEMLLILLRHGLSPTKHQHGIILASYARNGPPLDTLFLLDLLEGVSSPEHRPSATLVQQLQSMGEMTIPTMEDRGGPPDVKAYTAVLVGLTQQGELATAREVEGRVEGREFEKDFGWRIALQKLGKKDGLGARREVKSAAREREREMSEERELEKVEERLSM
ncbi:hypothetical protein BCR35DRAFT_43098 [Leucosporidium creatinivorum]|uniref:Uncharacterized protein n=1 Tax=Leucosporidium creatinivorum TaxID=106004 RepID=A0A1Y2C2K2_9BASI|nr:hypothetical protein BCR35DRAFT_43098 [Leucosporidium creatinivorum]